MNHRSGEAAWMCGGGGDDAGVEDRAETGVVVGVDDSLAGLQALREAVRFARGLNGQLRAVRACESPMASDKAWGAAALCPAAPTAAQWEAREATAREYIEGAFAQALGGVPPDIPVAATVVFAPVRDALLSCAATADLLVVGASRRWSVSRWFPPRRQVGEYCVVRASCPVVVVPAHAAAREAEAWGPLGWIRRRRELASLTATASPFPAPAKPR